MVSIVNDPGFLQESLAGERRNFAIGYVTKEWLRYFMKGFLMRAPFPGQYFVL